MKTCFRRCGETAGWAVPGIALLAMPKCPACLAAYIALATGVGISIPVASAMRWSILAASVALLAFLAVRRVCAFVRR